MTTPVEILGLNAETGTVTIARVSRIGQLVTAPFDYDDVVFKELSSANTASNFFEPLVQFQFIVTGMHMVADKGVSSQASATVVVYEASSPTSTTTDKVLFQTAIVQDQIQSLIPLNIEVSEGKYLNAKTDDASVHMTIMGYFIPAQQE